MKNTSILIPIILIGCLLALALLITKAFAATDGSPSEERIVLDQDDYRPPATSTAPAPDRNFDAYDQQVPADRTTDGTAAGTTDGTATDGTTATGTARPADRNETLDSDDYEPVTDADEDPDGEESATTSNFPASNGAATAGNAGVGSGRYLVIAGTFRQLSNASARVAALRRAGFSETELEKFDRGTFAVALAGRSDRYSTASELANRIRAAGFEARVMRRR